MIKASVPQNITVFVNLEADVSEISENTYFSVSRMVTKGDFGESDLDDLCYNLHHIILKFYKGLVQASYQVYYLLSKKPFAKNSCIQIASRVAKRHGTCDLKKLTKESQNWVWAQP